MLLVIDIGNTQTVIGLFEGYVLDFHWRLATDIRKTSDEYSLLVGSLIAQAGLGPKDIRGVGICSVVPPLSHIFVKTAENLFGLSALLVGPGVKTGMPILYENPAEVGSDRIANSIAAYEAVHGSVIIVDFGTATTFCAISETGQYLGGSIVPGIGISADALFEKTAKLPRVEIRKPAKVIGKTTVSSIQSGLFYGHLCIVEGMIRRITEELSFKKPPQVFATGGLAVLFAKETEIIDTVDPHLTLKGIRIIYEKNR
ncbi:MAG: type III pantothenate kinase [Candidatus Coatesbacteria bacterium]|nr:type III pantothenate kinase [Candidatus Coatesbacteria bacterium]